MNSMLKKLFLTFTIPALVLTGCSSTRGDSQAADIEPAEAEVITERPDDGRTVVGISMPDSQHGNFQIVLTCLRGFSISFAVAYGLTDATNQQKRQKQEHS